MGQGRSCIQGTPDWLGPYEKPLKANSDEFYGKISELILLGAISKDYTALEDFLANAGADNSTAAFLKGKKSATIDVVPRRNKAIKIEDIIHKETECKSINFSDEQKMENKTTNVKPVIARSQCAVHGHQTTVRQLTVPNDPGMQARRYHYPDCPLSQQTPKSEIASHNRTIQSPSRFQVSPTSHLSGKISGPAAPPPVKKDAQSIRVKVPRADPASAAFRKKLDAAMPTSQPDGNENGCDLMQDRDFHSADCLEELLFSDDDDANMTGNAVTSAVNAAKDNIRLLEDRAENVVEVFAVVLKHMEHGDWSTFCVSASRLCDDIRKVLRENNIHSDDTDPDVIKIRNHVTVALNHLTAQIIQSNEHFGEKNIDLLPSFRALGEVLHELMEFLIARELSVITESLQNAENNHSIKTALCALGEMSMSGALMKRLIGQAGAMRPLMKISEHNHNDNIRLFSLRVMKILAAGPESLPQADITAAMEMIANILISSADEAIKQETISVLAEITAQWTEETTSKQRLNPHLQKLVKMLIDTMQTTSSTDTYLCCAASLSTLSQCNTDALLWVKSHENELKLLMLRTKQESYV